MKKIILVIILLLALILRFYNLDSYPALNADEAALGYNAYSLIETGMDEHGHTWPLHFQSFNDYKPGLYVYLIIPFVKFFGLNEWTVRIPGAIFGVATVLVLYFLVKLLFTEKQKFFIAEISAFMLAISPWHIHFSRGGWEVNVATFFITLGILLFLKAVQTKFFRYFLLSLLSLGLAMYTYHASRVILPILGAGLLAIYWKDLNLKLNAKKYFLCTILFGIFMLPLLIDLLRGNVLARAAGVGLFADPGPLNRINEQRGEHLSLESIPSKLIHNKAVNYGLSFLSNWADHYHGEFLFLTGDTIERDKVPETGQMYLFDFAFLILGITVLCRNLFHKSYQLVFLWVVVAPIAAALTFQAPHALRAHNMVIPLVIISGVGLVSIFEFLKNHSSKFTLFAILAITVLVVWNFLRYQELYWNHMTEEFPFSSQYGVKELVEYVKNSSNDYEKIVVTDRYDQPYILFLFYLNYDPSKFQMRHSLSSRDQFGFSTVRSFDKFIFEKINFDEMRIGYPKSLIVGTTLEIPKEANVIKRIYGTNNYEYFDIVAN